jgi:hypothetical protein
VSDPIAESRVWAQLVRRYRLPREAGKALVLAVRNGADADAYTSQTGVHVFVHLPGAGLKDAVLAEALRRAGFSFDEETGAFAFGTG